MNEMNFFLAFSTPLIVGSVTMTMKSCKNGTTTFSRKNFSGYVAHVTIWLNVHYCMPFSSRIRIRVGIRCSVCLRNDLYCVGWGVKL